MKQHEFFKMIDECGIDLHKLSIVIGERCGWEGTQGLYEKDGRWIFYSADGRNYIEEVVMNNEDEAFDEIFNTVNVELRSFTNKFVSREIAKLPKQVVCDFLRKEYSLTTKQIDDAWNYLKQDMRVLFEFKYYIATGEFVPEKHSYKVQGYSAEKLHKTTYLEVLGAFNYLIYLRNKPKEALLNLEKGLPRRKVFSAADVEKINGQK